MKEFCLITEDTYTKEEVVSTEWKVLVALNFELTVPTVRAFLRRFVKAAAATYPGGEVDPRCSSEKALLPSFECLDTLPPIRSAKENYLIPSRALT